jgi:hypothetical protein
MAAEPDACAQDMEEQEDGMGGHEVEGAGSVAPSLAARQHADDRPTSCIMPDYLGLPLLLVEDGI